jgi:hypothetical protein
VLPHSAPRDNIIQRRSESDRLVADIERPPTSAYTNAQIHAWRGEKDRAVQWLTSAFQERATALIALRLDPVLKRLQTDNERRESRRFVRHPHPARIA